VDVGLGAATSAVFAGTEVGALVAGEGGEAGATVGRGVAVEHAARRARRIGRIFFMR